MKRCSYCGTLTGNDAARCPACGSRSFLRVCDNCGREFSQGAYCPSCGVKAGQPPKVCPECGTRYYSNACPNCGFMPGRYAAQQPVYNVNVVNQYPTVRSNEHWGRKNKWTAWFLCLFLGVFGAHKFYEGKGVQGILYLFTFGLFGIGWFIDLISLLFKPTWYIP